MKNKMILWVAGVVSVVVVLMALIVYLEPLGEGITRAQACKALALALTSQEDCEKKAGERETSHFSQKEKDNWFVKYMDLLYDEGYLDESLTPATLASAQDKLTYKEAAHIAEQVSKRLKTHVTLTKKNRENAYPEDKWWELYDQILKETDKEGAVEEIDAVLYGTPSNIPDAASWTAYTTKGNYGFRGLALDSYIDCEIRFLARDGEMIAMRELVSREVVYENVWLAEADNRTFQAYLGTLYREFPVNGRLGEETDLSHNLADLHLTDGVLKKVTIKKEKISGKVLSVTDQAIEIEGYGELPLSENFHVYKVYGDFKVLKPSDILVGYDLQEFVAADGMLCAALLEHEFDAKTIRVLLMNTGFQSLFHETADLLLNCGATVEYETAGGDIREEHLEAGTELTITPEDERLSHGRMVLIPDEPEGITLRSVERSQGQPVYTGSLEIKAEEGGLVLVNELYLEDYLTKVVPSEMPPSYEMEALKAQAVCARTYAYRQIMGNTYSQYGAHVDDSTNFQVYNNTQTNERTDRAVKETYGKMLFYNGKPAEAFYYSTSCGRSADGSVWGSDGAALPYLRAMEIKSNGKELDEDDNDSFDSYIRKKDAAAYDSSFPMFRWETEIPASALTGKIAGIGEVTDLQITDRGAGGIAAGMKATGTEGSTVVKGQSAIRSALGCKEAVITRQDKTTMDGSASLPSAFISIEKRTSEDGSISFHIYGGGFGHGVGMSQNGAQGMAKEGKDYKGILDFFYKGTELVEISEE